MTTYLLSCDHTIERDETPPKFVRCPSCIRGNDGYPKRRTVTIVDDTPESADGHEPNDFDDRPLDEPTTAGERTETWEPTLDEPNVAAETERVESSDDDESPTGEATIPEPPDGDDDDDEMSAAELLDGEQTAAMILERYRLAKAEHVILRSWDGNGERPATPNLDALNADHAAGVRAEDRIVKTSTTSSSRERRPAKPAPVLAAGEIQFMRNGKPLRGKHNRFSSLAGYCKIPVADLVSQLVAAGVAEPKTSSWSHVLSDGTKIAAVVSQGSEVSA